MTDSEKESTRKKGMKKKPGVRKEERQRDRGGDRKRLLAQRKEREGRDRDEKKGPRKKGGEETARQTC